MSFRGWLLSDAPIPVRIGISTVSAFFAWQVFSRTMGMQIWAMGFAPYDDGRVFNYVVTVVFGLSLAFAGWALASLLLRRLRFPNWAWFAWCPCTLMGCWLVLWIYILDVPIHGLPY